MSLSGWEALADVRLWLQQLPCRTGKPAEHGTLKGKIVWLGGSRRRPTVASAIAVSDG